MIHTTWINLKYTMISERCQMQKSTYCTTQFIGNARKNKPIVINRQWFSGAREQGDGVASKKEETFRPWQFLYHDGNGGYNDYKHLLKFI